MRKNFYLIESEINEYSARYEVCRFNTAITFICWTAQKASQSPEELKDLVSCLMEWYKAWAPPEEWVGLASFKHLPPISFSKARRYRIFFVHSQLPYPSVLRSTAILYYCLQRALCMPPLSTRTRSRRRRRTSKTKMGPHCACHYMEKFWDSRTYRSLREYHRQRWIRVHWGTCVEDVYGWVGEANVGGSARVDVREGCTVDVACVCERGCQPYVFPFFFFELRNVWRCNTAEEAKTMLQGVGSRFDFHINKTLCDLR